MSKLENVARTVIGLGVVAIIPALICMSPGCKEGNRYTDKIMEGETKIDFFQSPRLYVYAGVPLTIDSRTAITITKKDGNFIQYEDKFEEDLKVDHIIKGWGIFQKTYDLDNEPESFKEEAQKRFDDYLERFEKIRTSNRLKILE